VEYSVEEPVNIDGNCSVESVTQCRNLVSQSPDFTAGNIDQLCQYCYKILFNFVLIFD